MRFECMPSVVEEYLFLLEDEELGSNSSSEEKIEEASGEDQN